MSNLLLIESNLHHRRAFLQMVQHENLGYEVVTATSLAEAVERMHEQFFDLILSDLRLPDGSALDLLLHYAQVFPFIIITSAGDETSAVNVLKAGAYDYLVKDAECRYLQRLPLIIEQVVRLRRIKDEEADQRRFINALRDTAAALNSSLGLEEILTRIQRNIQKVIPFDSGSIMRVEGDQLSVIHTYRQPELLQDKLKGFRSSLSVNPFFQIVTKTRQPQTRSEIILKRDSQTSHLIQLRGACLSAPILMDGEVIGILTLQRFPISDFRIISSERLSVFADQVATALENARLQRQTIDIALSEERQRLARDLHDSVTQTLFAASVISGSLIKQSQIDPDSLKASLHDLNALTRDALAEMRSLLLDLRPDSNQVADLAAQIARLVATTQKRTNVQIKVVNQISHHPPPPIKHALFRITQEALNNIVRHAEASMVRITLKCESHSTELEIADDGIGFSLTDQRAQTQMGLTFMKERAEEAGIYLKIDSQQQHGTRIRAVWSSKG